MFLEMFPNVMMSYKKIRETFATKFNISFGYSRSDTCSTCDEQKANEATIEKATEKSTDPDEKAKLETDLRKLQAEIKLHKLRADWFYKHKRNAKMQAKKLLHVRPLLWIMVVIYLSRTFLRTMFITNGNFSSIRSTLMFWLVVNLFFYTYDQTVAKKGSDDVTFMLHHFILNMLDPSVRELHIFCDSCSGQNKNFTLIRFLHYMTVEQKMFDVVSVTFLITHIWSQTKIWASLIRGHLQKHRMIGEK